MCRGLKRVAKHLPCRPQVVGTTGADLGRTLLKNLPKKLLFKILIVSILFVVVEI